MKNPSLGSETVRTLYVAAAGFGCSCGSYAADVRSDQVVDLLDRIEPLATTVWLGGGWGVDALAGRETRPHGDLDLCVDGPSLVPVLEMLAGIGFIPREDWLPVRIEVGHPDGRRVDLHPVTVAADGSGTQAGLDGAVFVYPAGGTSIGSVDGRPVTCISALQQLVFRSGYDWREVDHHDVAVLRTLVERSGP
jgi:lincosamide nucleotidyltransferase A/C/D/E